MKRLRPPRPTRVVTPRRRASTDSTSPMLYAFLHAAHAVEGRMEEALGAVSLSGAKFAALSKLAEAGETLTLTDLASRLTCVRSNITQLVDRLEADGLVRRADDPEDRRAIRPAPTPLGRQRP